MLCGSRHPPEDVQRVVMKMPSVEETCPHCGKVNRIDGFAELFAFVCRFFGRGVNIASADRA
jgi:hypothetical protein